MTQLLRVEPKLASHFRSTPSLVPAQCGGAVVERSTRSASGGQVGDVRDRRGQWLGAPGDARYDGGQDLAERVAMPPTRTRAMCTNEPRPQLVPDAAGSAVQRRRMAAGRRDDTVDADEDEVDEKHERVEAV